MLIVRYNKLGLDQKKHKVWEVESLKRDSSV